MTVKTQDFSNYIGDVNIEHGGRFFDTSGADEDNEVVVLLVEPMDDAGMEGVVKITQVWAQLDSSDLDSALSYCDLDIDDIDEGQRAMLLADALVSYTGGDWDGEWTFVQYDECGKVRPNRVSGKPCLRVLGVDMEVLVVPDDTDLLNFINDQGFLADYGGKLNEQ